MRKFILTGLLAVLAGCSTYTDQTSPCVGRSGNPVVSRGPASPAPLFSPDVSRNATNQDCVFRPIGADA